jgi:hypothetical protein
MCGVAVVAGIIILVVCGILIYGLGALFGVYGYVIGTFLSLWFIVKVTGRDDKDSQ